jgi:hypothetical protein
MKISVALTLWFPAAANAPISLGQPKDSELETPHLRVATALE